MGSKFYIYCEQPEIQKIKTICVGSKYMLPELLFSLSFVCVCVCLVFSFFVHPDFLPEGNLAVFTQCIFFCHG